MWSVFDDHIAAALVTDHIRNLIFYLDCFLFLLRFFDGFLKIRIEVLDNRLPSYLSLCHPIKKAFHIGCEVHIHNAGERLLHNIIDHFADLCKIKILILLGHISSGNNCRNCRRISTWAADAQFLKRLYQRCLRIMGWRLGEMLL